MPHNNKFFDLHDHLEIAHATLSSFTAFFIIPAALYAGRYWRHNPKWYRVHWILNTLAVLIIVACFFMGLKSINGDQIGGKKSDTHHRFGLVSLLVMVVQALMGWASHYTNAGGPPPGLPAPGKHWSRYLHAFCGICTAGTLFAAIYSGMHEWTKSSDTGTPTPLAVRIVYWIMFAGVVSCYFVGFWWRPGTFKGKAVERNAEAGSSNESVPEEKDKDALAAA